MSFAVPEPPAARCNRCDMPLKVDAKPGSKAKLLRRAKTADGYCVHCAMHDWLRNTYPINLQLAESGPRILLYPHVRDVFAGIMRAGNSDATLDEINWNYIVECWDLPFPEPVKPSPLNPVTQKELDEVASGKRAGPREAVRQAVNRPADPLGGKTTIHSFEELNLLQPGLGDDLRSALHEQLGSEEERPGEPNVKPQAPWKQKGLFDETGEATRKESTTEGTEGEGSQNDE